MRKRVLDSTSGWLRSLVPTDRNLRLLSWVTLSNMFGNGMFLASQVLFFTEVVGLSALQVGAGIAIAGVCAVASGVPLGRMADRFGARRVLLVLLLAEGAGVLVYLAIDSFALFVVIAALVGVAGQGGNAVRGALIAHVIPADDRVRARAFLRSVANTAVAIGAGVAAVALQVGTRAAYEAVFVGDVATFLLAAGLLLRLRGTDPPPKESGGGDRRMTERRRALSDRPYLMVAVWYGVIAAHSGILEVGIPLWISLSTDAPRWVISAVLVINTVMVVVLQVRVSRGTDGPPGAARALLRAGALIAIACVLFGMAAGLPTWVAIVVLVSGGVVYTFGEMLSAAAGWSASYDLADPQAHGEYQGVFNSATTAGLLVSPLLVTATAIGWGMPGWLLLAGLFGLAGTACLLSVRRAAANREQLVESTIMYESR